MYRQGLNLNRKFSNGVQLSLLFYNNDLHISVSDVKNINIWMLCM